MSEKSGCDLISGELDEEESRHLRWGFQRAEEVCSG